MPNLQSNDSSSVDRSTERADSKETAEYVGKRVRAAMERRGWLRDDGGYDVKRLAEAVGCRWQTAQEWIEGKTAPGSRYQRPVAQVLGMTLEELVGLALNHEPRSAGWREFLETEAGRSMTDEERKVLSMTPEMAGREYTAAFYHAQLVNLRTGTKPRT